MYKHKLNPIFVLKANIVVTAVVFLPPRGADSEVLTEKDHRGTAKMKQD